MQHARNVHRQELQEVTIGTQWGRPDQNQNHKVTIVHSGSHPSGCPPHSQCCFGTACFCFKDREPRVMIPIIINYPSCSYNGCEKLPYKTDNLHTLFCSQCHAESQQTQISCLSLSAVICPTWYMVDFITLLKRHRMFFPETVEHKAKSHKTNTWFICEIKRNTEYLSFDYADLDSPQISFISAEYCNKLTAGGNLTKCGGLGQMRHACITADVLAWPAVVRWFDRGWLAAFSGESSHQRARGPGIWPFPSPE